MIPPVAFGVGVQTIPINSLLPSNYAMLALFHHTARNTSLQLATLSMESSTEERRVIIRSRRELEPYGDLILKLLARPGMKFNDLPAALAEQGIYAKYSLHGSHRSASTNSFTVKR